jgi:OmpA-OmpF porin, OOP family
MKPFFFVLFIVSFLGLNAQVTSNPKIAKKSTDDVFINKIEITEKFTVVSMQYVAKTQKQAIKEFFENNPDQREAFKQMNPMMRQFLLQNLIQEGLGSTISFQPGSYIRLSDGKKYRFIKATEIPTAPSRINTEPGKKYYFKVYFEKLPKGFEKIDVIESDDINKEPNLTFWNFYGVQIINPKEGNQTQTLPVLASEETSEFRLYGKVLNAVTNKPVSAKILCLNAKNLQVVDSVQTSKSGFYEFIVANEEFVYKITSSGYDNLEESFDTKIFRSKGSFEKDIFLEPNKKEKTIVNEIKPIVIDKPVFIDSLVIIDKPIIIEDNPETNIGVPVQNEKATFKLDKVYFNVGDSKVLDESFEQLNNLSEYLKENEKLKIQIEGHTDNQGDSKENKKLSIDRAYNVREYLISKGIESKRIKFIGYGDTKPIAENGKEESRKRNRRVEYKIFE